MLESDMEGIPWLEKLASVVQAGLIEAMGMERAGMATAPVMGDGDE